MLIISSSIDVRSLAACIHPDLYAHFADGKACVRGSVSTLSFLLAFSWLSVAGLIGLPDRKSVKSNFLRRQHYLDGGWNLIWPPVCTPSEIFSPSH